MKSLRLRVKGLPESKCLTDTQRTLKKNKKFEEINHIKVGRKAKKNYKKA
jgi:hypothetical protein